MARRLKYGLIGAGMMGHEHIRNIQLLENAEVAALYEPDAGMRDSAVALSGGVAVGSIAELIERGDLDALVISSPNFMHVDQIAEVARLGALPMLVEKPLYTAPKDAARVAEIIQTYPAPIWVAMEYRYMPPIAQLIAEAEAVTGGIKLLTIREHRFPFLRKIGDWNRFNKYSGGTLVEKCCHFFDLMRFILKAEPVRVMASAGQMNNHLDEVYDGETSDIWDAGYVIVDFDTGARAMLELCMFAEGSSFQEEISAVGPKGKIECLVPGPGRMWPEHLGAAPVPQIIRSPRTPRGPERVEVPVDPALLKAGDHNGATFYQHAGFQQVVLGQGAPEVSLEDGARAVAMGLAAQRSARDGRAVELSF